MSPCLLVFGWIAKEELAKCIALFKLEITIWDIKYVYVMGLNFDRCVMWYLIFFMTYMCWAMMYVLGLYELI